MEKHCFVKPLVRIAVLTFATLAAANPTLGLQNQQATTGENGIAASQESLPQSNEPNRSVQPEIKTVNSADSNAPSTIQEDARVASNTPGLPSPTISLASEAAPHPLDRAIEMANQSLSKMRSDVLDYTGLFYRRECFEGVTPEPCYMQLKIRCPRNTEAGQAPFSIYMKFLKPRQSAGRECIWVDGFNDGKIIAHEGRGLLGLKRFYLEPRGLIAMRESRYPIYEAGIENLITKLIEKAERDRAAGPCEVTFKDNCEVNGRKCTMIQVKHEEQKEPYDFHIARVFIDQENRLPIAYAAYNWPATPGGKVRLIEEYHYLNLKINVGLTLNDFSADNPSYSFPKR